MSDDANEKIKVIAMSEQPPIKIDLNEWDTEAEAYWFDGEIECQATRRCFIKVRRKNCSSTVVYGRYESEWAGEHARTAGYLVDDTDDLVQTIRRVAGAIDAPNHLAQECINDLPPVKM